MKTRPLLACLAVVILLDSPGPAADRPQSADWPQWRGPARDGVSTETGLLSSWPEDGPPLVWKESGLGSGYSTVSVARGQIFTMGDRSAENESGEYVVALDAESGRELWAVRSGEAYENNRGGGPRSAPTVDGELLYALGANGDLLCLDADTGTLRWRLNLLEQFGARNIRWGISESPLIEGDLVIVSPGAAGASIVALRKESGELVWKTDELDDRAGYSSAIAADVDGARQILQFTARGGVGVSARDGALLWRYDQVANKTADVATPIYQDGHVFFSSAYNTGCALLRLSGRGPEARAEEVYFSRDMMNHHSSCVLIDGHLYGYSGAILTCMEFATGKVRWKDRSVGKGSLIYADGRLYCFSEQGVAGLVEATLDGYREHGRFTIEHGDLPTWSHPVVTGGRLYLRDQDTLYCFDVRAR